MKNSAWYQKLWLKKLDELPVQEDSKQAWTSMEDLLDQHMPVKSHTLRPFGIKLISLLGYIAPAAAMVGGATFIVIHTTKPKVVQSPKNNRHIYNNRLKNSGANTAALTTDSSSLTNENALLNATGNTKLDNAVKPDGQKELTNRSLLTTSGSTASPAGSRNNNAPGSITGIKKTGQKALTSNAFYSNAQKAGNLSNHFPAQKNTETLSQDGKGRATNEEKPLIETNYAPNTHPAADPDNQKNSNNAGAVALQNEQANHNTPGEIKKSIRSKSQIRERPTRIKMNNGRDLDLFTPTYNYGVEAGVNTTNKGSLYWGVFGSYALNKRWLLNAGLRINSGTQLAGKYSHPSTFRPDSLPPFQVVDSRKVLALDIPVNLAFRVSKLISLKAGPLISISMNQLKKTSKISLNDSRDTLNHSQDINNAISKTTLNNIAVGFSSGISIHIKQIDLDARYQSLTPYKVHSDLGSYSNAYHTFQFGIGYRFK